MFRKLLLALLLLMPVAAWGASPIDNLPTVGTGASQYPLPDPAFTTENLWITQGGVDYKIDPLRAGYIYVNGIPPAVPYIYQLWWNTGVTPTTLYYYDGTKWVPLFGTGSCPTATTSVLGCVKPDGTTITITSGGVITAVGCHPAGTQYEVLLDNGDHTCIDVAGLGTIGFVLTSNGPGVAPTFQAAGGGSGTNCGSNGVVGQVCNSNGGSAAFWGQEVLGAPAAAGSGGTGSTVTITGGAGDGGGTGAPVNITGGVGGASFGDGGAVTIISGGSNGGGVDGDLVLATPDNSTGTPGHIEMHTGNADAVNANVDAIQIHTGNAVNSDSGAISIYTGTGGDNRQGGTLFLGTGNAGGTSGTDGDIIIATGGGPVGGGTTASVTGGDIQILAQRGTSNLGCIQIALGTSVYGCTGLVLESESNALFGTTYHSDPGSGVSCGGGTSMFAEGNFLQFLAAPAPNPYPGATGLIVGSLCGGAAFATTEEDIEIVGQHLGGASGQPAHNGGTVYISGGPSDTLATNTYAGNHTGNVVLGGGINYAGPSHFDTGNVIFASARADQSYQYANSGTALTGATTSGLAILDGVTSPFTFTLPQAPQNGRIQILSTTAAIASFTLAAPGGAAIKDAPTSLSAGQAIRYIYRAANTTWYPF